MGFVEEGLVEAASLVVVVRFGREEVVFGGGALGILVVDLIDGMSAYRWGIWIDC